jgi:hypothetical protein
MIADLLAQLAHGPNRAAALGQLLVWWILSALVLAPVYLYALRRAERVHRFRASRPDVVRHETRVRYSEHRDGAFGSPGPWDPDPADVPEYFADDAHRETPPRPEGH